MLTDDIASGMENSTGMRSDGSGITTAPDIGESGSSIPSSDHFCSVRPRALACPALEGIASTSISGLEGSGSGTKSSGIGNMRLSSFMRRKGRAIAVCRLSALRLSGAVSQKKEAAPMSFSRLKMMVSAVERSLNPANTKCSSGLMSATVIFLKYSTA